MENEDTSGFSYDSDDSNEPECSEFQLPRSPESSEDDFNDAHISIKQESDESDIPDGFDWGAEDVAIGENDRLLLENHEITGKVDNLESNRFELLDRERALADKSKRMATSR